MTVTCKKCNDEFEKNSKLNTHVLLKHPKLARSNSDQYSVEVSDKRTNTKANLQKEEQFRYK